MPYDSIQGQDHRGLKCAKMADFKVCLLRQYACNPKKLTLNYCTPRQLPQL